MIFTWDSAAAAATAVKVGRYAVSSDEELVSALLGARNSYDRAGVAAPVLIDSGPDVPWNSVVHVIDLCRREKIGRIEFVAP